MARSEHSIAVTNMAALDGRWEFQGNRAKYLGVVEEKLNAGAPTSGIGFALAEPGFREGCLSVKIRGVDFLDRGAGIFFGRDEYDERRFTVKLGGGQLYNIIEWFKNGSPKIVARVLGSSNLDINSEYQLDVRITGQQVHVEVDRVRVLAHRLEAPLTGSGVGLWAIGAAPIEFTDFRIQTEKLRAFVAMPFREPFDSLYKDVIYGTATSLGFDVSRVDEIDGPGVILDDIRRRIEESHLVVAEISQPNPNVFYELGYAHALNKPAVLLARREDGGNIPFDIRGYRAIFYDDTIGGKKSIEDSLRRHLEAVRRGT